MKLKTQDLTQSKSWLSAIQRQQLGEVLRACFSNITPEDYLAEHFDSPSAYDRTLRLYYAHGDTCSEAAPNNKPLSHAHTCNDTDERYGYRVVGFCLLTFTQDQMDKSVVIIQASAGFLPEYRKGSHTFQFSLWQSFLCWLKQPWRNIYYADAMLSPAMYRATAKHCGIVWPHPAHEAPKALFERFNPDGLLSAHNHVRCLVNFGCYSHYSAQELASFKASNALEIQYFQTVNPSFTQGMALFVIIPVNLKQLIKTVMKFLGA
jgi:hypothetical protein